MLKLNHIGCLVNNIEEATDTYKAMFGEQSIGKKIFISSEKVYICFIKIGDSAYLELIQPTDESSTVWQLKKKGITYYHIGYISDDFSNTIKSLEQLNFKQLSCFKSEAFNQKRCSFLISPEGHLMEVIEK